MPATSRVGGQQDLPAGGQRRLPGHNRRCEAGPTVIEV
jgi:hypothetical protein